MKDTLFWVGFIMTLSGVFTAHTSVWIRWISDIGLAVVGGSLWLGGHTLWAFAFWLLTPLFMFFTLHLSHRRSTHAREEVEPGQGDGEVPEGAPHNP